MDVAEMDKAFTKGIRLIEALANSDRPRGVTDLAVELELTKSNVHRLLATLQQNGFVQQVPNQTAYKLTIKIWELGQRVMGRVDLVGAARPAMQRLAELTHETVHLSVLQGLDVVYIDKIETDHHVRAHTRIGARAPAYTMATGKAMLAQMPDDYLDALGPELTPYTATTLTRLDDLRADLAKIRRQGFAIVPQGEWRDGIAACACAILGPNGQLAGAIGISGPDTRLKARQLREFSQHVVAAARDTSGSLGYSGDS
ncbi:Transcriptional regulator KdgR (plasmid) [Sulfitobacter sp. THAF37]|nr:Transcriptional regulator KdgR [Sulfitobacter sp. THAF37]